MCVKFTHIFTFEEILVLQHRLNNYDIIIDFHVLNQVIIFGTSKITLIFTVDVTI